MIKQRFLQAYNLVEGREMPVLFLATFFIHAVFAIFLYTTGFFPFNGGRDDLTYHEHAIEYAQWFRSFDYSSLHGLYTSHWYPAVLGFLYALSFSSLLIGMAGSSILAGITAILLYLLMRELGGAKRTSFLITFGVVNLYLSFLWYGTLTLKDTWVVPLVLFMLLLTIKLVQKFTWKNTAALLIVALLLATLRFYAFFILLCGFFGYWFLWSRVWQRKKTFVYGFILFFLFGFELQILGMGFLGIPKAVELLEPTTIANKRERAYSYGGSETNVPVFQWEEPTNRNDQETGNQETGNQETGNQETGNIDDYGEGVRRTESPSFSPLNYVRSFANAAFGPFPWHLKSFLQFAILIETISWYILLILIVKGVIREFPWKRGLPVLFFGLALLAAVSLFSDNLGANTRLRMAAFMSLSAFAPLAFLKHKTEEDRYGENSSY